MKKVILFITINVILLFATNSFVIGAYDVVDTSYFVWAHDSLKLNTVVSGWLDKAFMDEYLNSAEAKGLEVIFPEPEYNQSQRLGLYCNFWHSIWEAEENSQYFRHQTGNEVQDNSASDSLAWKCAAGTDQADTMLWGRSQWQMRIPTRTFWNYTTEEHYDSLGYTAWFRLKIEDKSNTSATICTLLIVFDDTAAQETLVLTASDFAQEDVYEMFDITFKKGNGSNNLIWPFIIWNGTVGLWADYVEIKDQHIDSLIDREYDAHLDSIFTHFDPVTYQALFRYRLIDEPRIGQFASNRYIREYLDDNYNTPGVQTLGGLDSTFFQLYADSVAPQELWVDYYPFYGDSGPDGRVPEDSGAKFQRYLDSLCSNLTDIRAVAQEESKEFWYAAQAFGMYATSDAYSPDSGGSEGRWRYPTQRELRCHVWLALAHGAKGIAYYLYKTRTTTVNGIDYWMRGLWRTDSTPREPLYTEASDIDTTLMEVGSTLIASLALSITQDLHKHGIIRK